MTETTTISEQLERLLQLEPTLKESLSQAQGTEQIVTLLCEAAARHNLPLDAAAMRQAMETMRQIGQLVEADPELARALEHADSAPLAAELIQRAARRRDVRIGLTSSAARELSDNELEHAAGGVVLEAIVIGGAMVGLTALGVFYTGAAVAGIVALVKGR